MAQHQFIFSPGNWLGQGNVQMNVVKDQLKFFTKWTIEKGSDPARIHGIQEIQIEGVPEVMKNHFNFYNFTSQGFQIELENQSLGKVVGTGVISPTTIAWEFRLPELGFEGFEFYELKEDKSYFMHAEYSTSDQFRTVIQGKVWVKTQET